MYIYMKKIEVHFCEKMIKQFSTQKNKLFTYRYPCNKIICIAMNVYVEIIIIK